MLKSSVQEIKQAPHVNSIYGLWLGFLKNGTYSFPFYNFFFLCQYINKLQLGIHAIRYIYISKFCKCMCFIRCFKWSKFEKNTRLAIITCTCIDYNIYSRVYQLPNSVIDFWLRQWEHHQSTLLGAELFEHVADRESRLALLLCDWFIGQTTTQWLMPRETSRRSGAVGISLGVGPVV